MIKINPKIFLIWIHLFLPSQLGHAATFDDTLIQQCANNFTNCTETNCTITLESCLNSTKKYSTIPLSCYQEEAAAASFNYALYLSISVLFASLIIVPLITSGLEICTQKITCCTEDSLADTEIKPRNKIDISKSNNFLKIMIAKLLDPFSKIPQTMVSSITIAGLFSLWQTLKTAEANCNYDLEPLPPPF